VNTFDRPYRGPGVRIVNAVSGLLGWLGRKPRPLDADEILDLASRKARLPLGDAAGDLREPLERLVRSFEEDANLHAAGRLLARLALVHFVANRLRLDALLADRPAVAAAPLHPALIVVGLPRTGTTLLYNLLAQDPVARPLATWESFFPVPRRADGATRDRQRRARWLVKVVDKTAPGVQSIHPLDADGPEEDTWLLAHTLVSNTFSLMGSIDSYDDWIESLDGAALERSYSSYRRQLQWLQHETWPDREGSFWLLKSPAHLATLEGLLRSVPEARIVQTHRDPVQVAPSTCSLFAVVRSIFSDTVDPRVLGPSVSGRFAAHARRATAARKAHPGRVVDLSFEKLVADPIEAIAGIYAGFDRELTPATREAMTAWLATHREPPSHKYALDQFGLDEGMVRGLFSSAG
jgi:Sulfotransferase family